MPRTCTLYADKDDYDFSIQQQSREVEKTEVKKQKILRYKNEEFFWNSIVLTEITQWLH